MDIKTLNETILRALEETSDSLVYKSNVQRHKNRADIEQALRDLSAKRKNEIDRIENAVLLSSKEKEEEIDKIDAEYIKEKDLLMAELDKAEKKLSNNYDLTIKRGERLNAKDESVSINESDIDITVYILRHPDYPEVEDIALRGQTLIKYAEERREDFRKTDNTITKNTITNVFGARDFLKDNGFTIQEYVLQ